VFETDFFSDGEPSLARWRNLTATVMTTLERSLPRGPYAGGTADDIAPRFAGPVLPDQARTDAEVMVELADIVGHAVAVWNPHTAAHLHCPVLLPALAAEQVISALNQSMDSFDQAPSATLLELKMAAFLCRLAGLPDSAAATFTSGGTQCNYMGLLLARDTFAQRHWNHCTRQQGLPPAFRQLKILCSRFAHFSVEKSALQLGLGADSVVLVDTDAEHRLDPLALDAALARIAAEGNLAFAIVATAGTTDFGAIDPLAAIADRAKRVGAWLHVDAAYGGALLMSPSQRQKLSGLERADSITIDFHKAFFQPVSCSAFLVADRAHFDLIRVNADYLNPDDHESEGFPDLVNWSLQTTKRFDALKLWLSFQMVGAERFAAMIDAISGLAEGMANRIAADRRFELLHRPGFSAVVFRWCSGGPAELDNRLNEAIPKQLFRDGKAVLGHTRIDGRACLKVTLINPLSSDRDLAALLETIADSAAAISPHLA